MLQHDQATQPTRPSNGRVKMNTYTLLRFKDKHKLEHCNRVLRSIAITPNIAKPPPTLILFSCIMYLVSYVHSLMLNIWI